MVGKLLLPRVPPHEPMAGPPRPRVPRSDELPMVADWDTEPTTGAPPPDGDATPSAP